MPGLSDLPQSREMVNNFRRRANGGIPRALRNTTYVASPESYETPTAPPNPKELALARILAGTKPVWKDEAMKWIYQYDVSGEPQYGPKQTQLINDLGTLGLMTRNMRDNDDMVPGNMTGVMRQIFNARIPLESVARGLDAIGHEMPADTTMQWNLGNLPQGGPQSTPEMRVPSIADVFAQALQNPGSASPGGDAGGITAPDYSGMSFSQALGRMFGTGGMTTAGTMGVSIPGFLGGFFNTVRTGNSSGSTYGGETDPRGEHGHGY